MGPLKIAFLFHFNQDFSPYIKIAYQSCYKGLTNILLNSDLEFNLHLSGTLLKGLDWYYPNFLEKIKTGLKEKKFEILGSTYSQNVMFSTDETSNKWQIELHLEIIEKLFKIRPKGFWMPERSWKNKFIKILKKYDYNYSIVEDHILKKSGSKDIFKIKKINNFILLPDNEHFKHLVNLAIWTGIDDFVFEYLHGVFLLQTKNKTKYLITYCEDAEASGLWSYHFGVPPEYIWSNLKKLLIKISNDSRFQVVSISKILENYNTFENLKSLKSGNAIWMDYSAKDKLAPYHEDGYKSWNDFLKNSPKIKKYKVLFKSLSKKILTIEKYKKFSGLIKYAKEILASHQYEFGCIGIGSYNCKEFDDAKKLEIILWLIKNAHKDTVKIFDIDNDGADEIVIKNKSNLFVLSRFTGEVLYWVNLKKQSEITGNSTTNIVSENKLNKKILSKVMSVNKGDIWFKHFIPKNIFHLLPSKIKYFSRNKVGFKEVGKKLLTETIKQNGKIIYDFKNPYSCEYYFDRKNIIFYFSNHNIFFKKYFIPQHDGFRVDYFFYPNNKGNLEIEVYNRFNIQNPLAREPTNINLKSSKFLRLGEKIYRLKSTGNFSYTIKIISFLVIIFIAFN